MYVTQRACFLAEILTAPCQEPNVQSLSLGSPVKATGPGDIDLAVLLRTAANATA